LYVYQPFVLNILVAIEPSPSAGGPDYVSYAPDDRPL
jgi:hypothetical protein